MSLNSTFLSKLTLYVAGALSTLGNLKMLPDAMGIEPTTLWFISEPNLASVTV
jgi:hypothetical protein